MVAYISICPVILIHLRSDNKNVVCLGLGLKVNKKELRRESGLTTIMNAIVVWLWKEEPRAFPPRRLNLTRCKGQNSTIEFIYPLSKKDTLPGIVKKYWNLSLGNP